MLISKICSYFLNIFNIPHIFLITGFWKKGNENGTKTFEFNPWKENSNDQDNQSYHKDIKNSFLKYCLSA